MPAFAAKCVDWSVSTTTYFGVNCVKYNFMIPTRIYSNTHFLKSRSTFSREFPGQTPAKVLSGKQVLRKTYFIFLFHMFKHSGYFCFRQDTDAESLSIYDAITTVILSLYFPLTLSLSSPHHTFPILCPSPSFSPTLYPSSPSFPSPCKICFSLSSVVCTLSETGDEKLK